MDQKSQTQKAIKIMKTNDNDEIKLYYLSVNSWITMFT